MGMCEEWLKDPNARCVYFAVLIVLIFLVVYYLKRIAGPERMEGAPAGGILDSNSPISGAGMGKQSGSIQADASGASMRHSSEQSQPGEGLRNTQYNKDVVWMASVLGKPSPSTTKLGQDADFDIAAAAAAAGNGSAAAGSMERLVNYRYAPQFEETWSEELQRYQAMTPPIEYKVLDDATKGFVSGDQFQADVRGLADRINISSSAF